jgi:hypothetical protein
MAEIDQKFDQLWGAYPRREGSNPKQPAREKFGRLVRDGVEPDEIIAGARAYASDPGTKPGTQYVRMMITWLNQGQWSDYRPSGAGPPMPPGLTPEQQKDWAGGWRPGMPSSAEISQRRKHAERQGSNGSVLGEGEGLRRKDGVGEGLPGNGKVAGLGALFHRVDGRDPVFHDLPEDDAPRH